MCVRSAVVQAFDTAGSVDASLRRVLRQSYADCATILIDDGVTGGTGAILDRVDARDSFVRVVHKQHMGNCDRGNVGMETFHDNYLCFLNSDVLLESDVLEDLVVLAEYDFSRFSSYANAVFCTKVQTTLIM